jgi:hypothetical protein
MDSLRLCVVALSVVAYLVVAVPVSAAESQAPRSSSVVSLNGKRLFLKCSHSGCESPCLRVAVYYREQLARFENDWKAWRLDDTFATFYRDIVPNNGFVGQDVPAEIVAGAIHTACGYNSGLTLGVYKLGEGRFTLNTLRIRENLGGDPVAERLLRNMLRHAARDLSKPLADLPAGFDAQLKTMGY